MHVVDVLRDETFQTTFGLKTSKPKVSGVGLRRAEVLVEDLFEDRPRTLGVREEAAQLQLRGIVGIPQASPAAKRRDAAFHADHCAGEGGKIACRADESGGFMDQMRFAAPSSNGPWCGAGRMRRGHYPASVLSL